MGPLNDQQFADHINLNSGGSRSVHTGVPLLIGTPKTFAVGQPGHEAVVPRPVGSGYVGEHRAGMLADPAIARDPDALQGGWQPHGGTTTVLDHSRAVLGRREAVVQGRANREQAVFGFEKGRDIVLSRNRPAPSVSVGDDGRRQVTRYAGNQGLGYEQVTYAPSRYRPAPRPQLRAQPVGTPAGRRALARRVV